MIGREAYHNPYMLARVDQDIYQDIDERPKRREEIVEQMCDYIDFELSKGSKLHSMTRHILGLYQDCRGAKAWRRHLSEKAHDADADSSVVKAALSYVND